MKYCILIWDEGFKNVRFWQNSAQSQVFFEPNGARSWEDLEHSIVKMASLELHFHGQYKIVLLGESQQP